MDDDLGFKWRRTSKNNLHIKEKPELMFKDLKKGKVFKTLNYAITKDLIGDYMQTVGDCHPDYVSIAPPGLAAIYARLSYLQDHCMPAGGVLAGQAFEFKGAVRIGDTLKVRAKVASSYIDDRKRKRVKFTIQAKTLADEPISVARLDIIWPK